MAKHWILCPIFFLSGMSGLVYQVVWVREFGNVFGNTVSSASIVTAIFMFGLGVGGYLAGRWADRGARQSSLFGLTWYARFEIMIGVLGLGAALILPSLEELSAVVSSYVEAPGGWRYLSLSSAALRYAVAIVLLTPITSLMGGTLTLLIKYVVSTDLSSAGWRIGLLYGFNTGGAALGCFLTDFAFVPNLGLFATQALAVALNFAAGLGALLLVHRHASDQVASAEAPGQGERSGGWSRLVALTGLAIFASGFAGMGMEIVWFRHLIALLGPYRPIFSLLLTTILVGMWLGATLGGYWVRRLGRPALGFGVAQTLFVLSTLGALYFTPGSDALRETSQELAKSIASFPDWVRTLAEYWFKFRLIMVIVGLPSVCMGMAFPLANANVQRVESMVGKRAGLLYLANTAGAVLGAVLAGFLLLPGVGIQSSTLFLTVSSGGAIIALLFADRSGEVEGSGARRALVLVGCLLATLLASFGWSQLPDAYLVRKSVPTAQYAKLVAVSEGVSETVAIVEDSDQQRRLLTNGHSMSSTGLTSQRYMRLFVHIPMFQIADPRRVLVICFGVGNTAHATTRYSSLQEIEIVDLSENVLQHAEYFSETNGDVLRDPRVRVFVNDGRQHLRMRSKGTYDLITAEPPPVTHAGVSALYSVEFYRLAKSRLKPDGIVTQWLPAWMTSASAVRSIVRAFIDVFPNAVLLSGEGTELILMGGNGNLTIDPERVAARLRSNDSLRRELREILLAGPTEVIGTFAASANTLRAATTDVAPVTDDYPVTEYAQDSWFAEAAIPGDLFSVSDVRVWCPGCFSDGRPHPEVSELGTYLGILGAVYQSPDFLTDGRTVGSFRLPATESVQRVISSSLYLRYIFKRAKHDFHEAQRLVQSGEVERAIMLLEDVVLLEPLDPAVFATLGDAYALAGDRERAGHAFKQALSLRSEYEWALRGLQKLEK